MKKRILHVLMLALASVMNATAAITPTESQMWWGYLSESDTQGMPYSGNLGYNAPCTIDAAIYVPAGDDFVGGSTIKAVRIWLGDNVTSVNSNMKVWISAVLPTDVDKSAYVQTVPQSALTRGVNEVELATPFEVNNQGIYVGFSFSIRESAFPIMSNGADAPHAFYYRVTNQGWNDFYGAGYGKLALQLLIDGGDYPTHSAVANDMGQYIVQKGESVTVPVVITNKGKNAISNITYTIATEGGGTTPETTIQVGNLAFNDSYTAFVTLKSDEEPKKYTKTFNITKVDGEANKSAAKAGICYLITITEKLAAVPVVEEFTGTWCGYCPNGIVGMQKARETYGDQVVLIAAHASDAMECADYYPILASVTGFPSARMNREKDFYPSASTMLNTIKSSLDRDVQGTIELSAMWTDEERKAVRFDTKTKFVYGENDGRYGIAYVLVEDGMTGSGNGWAQSNYLSGGTGDPDMDFWYKAGSVVPGLAFDHVAVAAWDIDCGVSGSVQSEIVAGAVQEYTHIGDISGNSLIQDKSKLKAIALLIDGISGAIVNAAQTTIQDYSTGVDASTSAPHAVAYYTIDGRQVDAMQKGLNIVKMSDGTSRKILGK